MMSVSTMDDVRHKLHTQAGMPVGVTVEHLMIMDYGRVLVVWLWNAWGRMAIKVDYEDVCKRPILLMLAVRRACKAMSYKDDPYDSASESYETDLMRSFA